MCAISTCIMYCCILCDLIIFIGILPIHANVAVTAFGKKVALHEVHSLSAFPAHVAQLVWQAGDRIAHIHVLACITFGRHMCS